MNKLVIKDNEFNKFVINSDCYVLINDEAQTKKIELNIINCKVTIIDKGVSELKTINAINSDVTVVEIDNSFNNSKLYINNDHSAVEYNIIDLGNRDINYSIIENSLSEGSQNTINIASICYKNKVKNYVVETENFRGNTVNEINCFGMVKDESLLNYDVTSKIVKGAKKSVVKQSSNILLFDKNSQGKNNPVLVIEENDVKASHGSSIGKIDDDTMFYLCSRGLSKIDATNLICLGRVEYLIRKISDESIKENLVNNFKERMK